MPDWLAIVLVLGVLLFGSWLFLLLIMFVFLAGASTNTKKYEDMFDINIPDKRNHKERNEK